MMQEPKIKPDTEREIFFFIFGLLIGMLLIYATIVILGVKL